MALLNARREDRGQKTLDPGQVDGAYQERYSKATNQFRERQSNLAQKEADKAAQEQAQRQEFWNQSFAGQRQIRRTQSAAPSALSLTPEPFRAPTLVSTPTPFSQKSEAAPFAPGSLAQLGVGGLRPPSAPKSPADPNAAAAIDFFNRSTGYTPGQYASSASRGADSSSPFSKPLKDLPASTAPNPLTAIADAKKKRDLNL